MKVGDTVFQFDQNLRVYPRNEKGNTLGGPIWREHWRKVKVIGETSRSWIIGYSDVKIPKNKPLPWGICIDEKELDKRAWVNDNAHKISEKMRKIPFELLATVAEIIGHTPKAP